MNKLNTEDMDDEKKRLALLTEEAVQGFTAYCGLEPVSLNRAGFVTRVTLRDCHLQQDGFVHAGVVATMADHTAGCAAYSLVPPDRRILTVEYKINFLVPASGDYLEMPLPGDQAGQDPPRDRIRGVCSQGRDGSPGGKGHAHHGRSARRTRCPRHNATNSLLNTIS